MKKFVIFFLFSSLVFTTGIAISEILKKDYHGFTVWLDCDRHGAIGFRYDLEEDKKNSEPESDSFKRDRSVNLKCQPKNGKSYKSDRVTASSGTWDRGHLVPANHMDHSVASIADTYFVTNVLPQQTKFNRKKGAWYQTEIIAECYRDITKLSIWGGVIWGKNKKNDFFVETHGVETPDFWWKLIYREDKEDFIAWLFPNNKKSKASKIDDFIVSIRELQSKVKFLPDLEGLENYPDWKPETSWKVTGSRTLKCEGITTELK